MEGKEKRIDNLAGDVNTWNRLLEDEKFLGRHRGGFTSQLLGCSRANRPKTFSFGGTFFDANRKYWRFHFALSISTFLSVSCAMWWSKSIADFHQTWMRFSNFLIANFHLWLFGEGSQSSPRWGRNCRFLLPFCSSLSWQTFSTVLNQSS